LARRFAFLAIGIALLIPPERACLRVAFGTFGSAVARRICFYQGCVNPHSAAAHAPLCAEVLEDPVTEGLISLDPEPISKARQRRMIGHIMGASSLTKPPIRQIELDLFTQAAIRGNCEQIPPELPAKA
jgi:hypothetical protein